MKAALVALAACSAPAHEGSLSNAAPVPPPAWPIVELTPVRGIHDCRISQVLIARWGREPVASCGIHAVDDRNAMVAGMKCVNEKRASGEPFVVFVAGRSDGSEVAAAWVGLREGGRLVLYDVQYDANPCHGSCSDIGGTRIRRCTSLDEGFEWWTCTGLQNIAQCEFGK